jgi:hypothetical protein
MIHHLLTYARWDVIGNWKRQLLKYAPPDGVVFLYGSDDDHQFGPLARNDAVIWVLASHRHFPPTLTACLPAVRQLPRTDRDPDIPDELLRHFRRPGNRRTGARSRPWKHVAVGGEGSRFYAHNYATKPLSRIELLNIDGETLKQAGDPWDAVHHGPLLMRPKEVRDPAPLLEHAAAVAARTIFLSWKHRDARPGQPGRCDLRRDVLDFVREVNKATFGVWLDMLALPNFHPNTDDDAVMAKLLEEGLRNSQAIGVVASIHYGALSPGSEENWTERELRSKPSSRRFALLTPAPRRVLGDGRIGAGLAADEVNHVVTGDAAAAARDFEIWFSTVNPMASNPMAS